MRLKNVDQLAAFNTNFFLHGFLRDFRKKRDSPTFLDDQRDRLRKFDHRVWSSHAATIEPPSATSAPSVPATITPPSAPSGPSVFTPSIPNPSVPVKPPLQSIPLISSTAAEGTLFTSTAAPLNQLKLDDVSINSEPLPRPKITTAGPVPSSSRERGAMRRPRESRSPFTVAGNLLDFMTPRDLEILQRHEDEYKREHFSENKSNASGSDDVQPSPKPIIPKTMDKKGKGKADENKKTRRVRLIVDAVKSKPKTKSKVTTEDEIVDGGNDDEESEEEQEEEQEDDDDEHKDDRSVIRYRPRKPTRRVSQTPYIPPNPIPTGELNPSKCSNCNLSGRECERQESGGACVNCRRYKHKCEFSRPRKRQKSEAVVESEEEEETPPTIRPRRMAAIVAKKAIKKEVRSSHGQNPPANEVKPRMKKACLTSKYLYLSEFYSI